MSGGNDFRLKTINTDGGFTLIETMVALMVFSIIALSMASMAYKTTLNNTSARLRTQAAVKASEEIERMMSLPYTAGRLDDGNHTIPDGGNATIVDENGLAARYEIRTEDALPRTKTVKITITYQDGKEPRTVSYNYLLPEII